MIGIVVWLAGLLATFWAATALPVLLRVLLTLIAMGLVLPVWRTVACGQGASAVRRVVWERGGEWTVTLAGGVVERDCRLEATSAAAGPWIWLRLRGRHRYAALLDRRYQDPVRFAALRRRLLAERRRALR